MACTHFVIMHMSFMNNISGKSEPIDVMVNTLRQQKIHENRKVLNPIIDTIKVCGHLALPKFVKINFFF